MFDSQTISPNTVTQKCMSELYLWFLLCFLSLMRAGEAPSGQWLLRLYTEGRAKPSRSNCEQVTSRQIGKIASASQMPQSPQLAFLPHRPFSFSITFLNPPGRLCTHHTQTDVNIHRLMHILSHFASNFHHVTSRWMCVGSFHWSTMHTNHSACQQTMESDPKQSAIERQAGHKEV